MIHAHLTRARIIEVTHADLSSTVCNSMKRKIDFDISSMRAAAAAPEASSSSGANSSINPWTQRSYSSKYYEILQKRKQLPVYEFKEALEKAVKDNQVVIVEGETGSGTAEIHVYVLFSSILSKLLPSRRNILSPLLKLKIIRDAY